MRLPAGATAARSALLRRRGTAFFVWSPVSTRAACGTARAGRGRRVFARSHGVRRHHPCHTFRVVAFRTILRPCKKEPAVPMNELAGCGAPRSQRGRRAEPPARSSAHARGPAASSNRRTLGDAQQRKREPGAVAPNPPSPVTPPGSQAGERLRPRVRGKRLPAHGAQNQLRIAVSTLEDRRPACRLHDCRRPTAIRHR